MRLLFIVFFTYTVFAFLFYHPSAKCYGVAESLSSFAARCYDLPERDTRYYTSPVSWQKLSSSLRALYAQSSGMFSQHDCWIGNKSRAAGLHNLFVQKAVLPEGSIVVLWGDLHGSVHSVLRCLERLRDQGYINDYFKIIHPQTYFCFLGDFVDRGLYGVEVIYTLLQLKLANPDRVFLVRGNHEDSAICRYYGFENELYAKFGKQCDVRLVYDLYQQLPMALFLGCKGTQDFVLCCHGGIEPGFDHGPLLMTQKEVCYAWISELNRKDWAMALPSAMRMCIEGDSVLLESSVNFVPCEPTHPYTIGFLWNDFVDDESTFFIKPSRGGCSWAFGAHVTEWYMEHAFDGADCPWKIAKIIRAHQHNGVMLEHLVRNKGMHALWDNKVCTLISAPGMPSDWQNNPSYFMYDSYAMLTVCKTWPIIHNSSPIFVPKQ